MIEEKNFEKYYEQIAVKLDEIIPTDWDRIVMYAEEIGDMSFACFYYYTNNNKEVHHCGNIPEECNVDRKTYDSLLYELMDINKDLWVEFKKAGKPPWCTLTFYLDKDWRFKVNYGYEIDLEISPLERELRWAYDELGLIPEYSYERKLLDRYLEGKANKD